MIPEKFIDPTAPVQPEQYRIEFEYLLGLYVARNPMKVLEIGSSVGGTLYQWMKHAATGAEIVAVDLPQGWPGARDGLTGSEKWAEQWPAWAEKFGVSFDYRLGNSQSYEVIEWVFDRGPYDWIFIDGNHTFEGVTQDYLNYSPMAKDGGIIAFHDIMPHIHFPDIGVHLLWNELRSSNSNGAVEVIAASDQPDMGIGVLYV